MIASGRIECLIRVDDQSFEAIPPSVSSWPGAWVANTRGKRALEKCESSRLPALDCEPRSSVSELRGSSGIQFEVTLLQR